MILCFTVQAVGCFVLQFLDGQPVAEEEARSADRPAEFRWGKYAVPADVDYVEYERDASHRGHILADQQGGSRVRRIGNRLI